jgi:hypothetical protein
MNRAAEIILALSGVIGIYGVIVSLWTFRAIGQKRYEAYRQKLADFGRLDREVKKAFGESDNDGVN